MQDIHALRLMEWADHSEAVRFTLKPRAGHAPFDVVYSVPPLRRPDPAGAPARVTAFADAGASCWSSSNRAT